jgi:antitoxin YobK
VRVEGASVTLSTAVGCGLRWQSEIARVEVSQTEFQDFEIALRRTQEEYSRRDLPEGFQLFDFWRATEADIQGVESQLNVRLPDRYKEFMRRYGGGQFLFLDLLPVLSPDGREDDLISVNQGSFLAAGFVGVAPVGTGDWWGFSVVEGVCGDAVDFLDHENGNVSASTDDFLDFLTSKGLTAR